MKKGVELEESDRFYVIERDDYEVVFQEAGKDYLSCTVVYARSIRKANEIYQKHHPEVVVMALSGGQSVPLNSLSKEERIAALSRVKG